MAALTAADVTVTQTAKANIVETQKHIPCSIVFGDGSKTYPAGGVPMPSYASFGLKRSLDYLLLYDAANANGFVYKYDKTNNKLRIYVQGITHDAAGSGTIDDYPVTAGEGVDTVSFGLVDAGAGTYRFGGLKEMKTGDAPAAATLKAIAVGW